MSLIKQLWLAISAVTLLVFGGAFLLTTVAARNYLAEQLYVKNVDNATVLALSMSQMPKDPVTLELQVSAQFDAGHYRSIHLLAPDGTTLLARQDDRTADDVPAWFAALTPLTVKPGVAQVQDGWKQFGRLEVESHTRYAQAELWRSTLHLAGWCVAAALLTSLVASLLLRLLLRPLDQVVTQAEAIGARRFITTEEPSTPELRRVVRAMNALSDRVKLLMLEESRRVEELRRKAQADPLTGLAGREAFMSALAARLEPDQTIGAGCIAVLRVTALGELNQRVGRIVADQCLLQLSESLRTLVETRTGAIAGRLNGSDFAILLPGESDDGVVLAALLDAAGDATSTLTPPSSLPIGATHYLPGEAPGHVLARMDSALAASERSGQPEIREAPRRDDFREPTDAEGWRHLLDEALAPGKVLLGHYPVVTPTGAVLHFESPVRLNLGGQWQPASRFVAWAARLGKLQTVDALVLDAAFKRIKATGEPLGINLSLESVRHPEFARMIADRLHADPELAQALWLEVPEHGAYHHLEAFRNFCHALKPTGCRIGLEHAGPGIARIGELHDVGLDYLKIDAAIIRGIDAHPGNQAFLRGLCMVAHAIGLQAIAEGVSTPSEREALPGLGIDGLTGPAIQAG